MNYLTLPIGERAPKLVNAVVEIPLGASNKYEYDKELQVFRLDRPLFSSVHYPCEYGFVPSTLAEDGDALDILLLAARPSFPGCLIEARPIGLLEMKDQGKADQKILAVAEANPEHRNVRSHRDLFPHVLRSIEHFFQIYKQLEAKQTVVLGWRPVSQAHKLINETRRRFENG